MSKKDGWNDEMDVLVAKRMQKSKKQNIESYYFNAKILVRMSRNWYRYAEEVYRTKDTTNYGERSDVYEAVIKRMSNEKNIAELIKGESILYAVLKN